MRIKNARRVRQEPSRAGFRTLARFAFEPTDGVLIYDCTIVEAPDGRKFIYGPPAANGATILSMAPEIRRTVISMTLREVGIDDRDHAAAA